MEITPVSYYPYTCLRRHISQTYDSNTKQRDVDDADGDKEVSLKEKKGDGKREIKIKLTEVKLVIHPVSLY